MSLSQALNQFAQNLGRYRHRQYTNCLFRRERQRCKQERTVLTAEEATQRLSSYSIRHDCWEKLSQQHKVLRREVNRQATPQNWLSA